jgi:hypothetical protein
MNIFPVPFVLFNDLKKSFKSSEFIYLSADIFIFKILWPWCWDPAYPGLSRTHEQVNTLIHRFILLGNASYFYSILKTIILLLLFQTS